MATGNLGNPIEREGNVDFTVDLDGQPMFCTISREALDDHFDAEALGRVEAYIANSGAIQARAQQAAKLAIASGAAPTKASRLLLQSKHF